MILMPLPEPDMGQLAMGGDDFRSGWPRSSVGYVLTIWVERLLISERVMRKIVDVHGIHPDQVRAAVERVEGLDFSWVWEPERGRKDAYVIIRSKIGEENVLVVLYPTDDPIDHEWRLASAYYIPG